MNEFSKGKEKDFANVIKSGILRLVNNSGLVMWVKSHITF